jgi:hypothetical protein
MVKLQIFLHATCACPDRIQSRRSSFRVKFAGNGRKTNATDPYSALPIPNRSRILSIGAIGRLSPAGSAPLIAQPKRLTENTALTPH